MANVASLLEKVNLAKPESAAEALSESLAPDIKRGMTVAIVADPTYPFAGYKGKVESVNNGYAYVKFTNGSAAHLMSSLLIPV